MPNDPNEFEDLFSDEFYDDIFERGGINFDRFGTDPGSQEEMTRARELAVEIYFDVALTFTSEAGPTSADQSRKARYKAIQVVQ